MLDLRELGPLGDGIALPRERGPVRWDRQPLRAEVLQPAAGCDDVTPRAFRKQSLNCCTSATGAAVGFVGEVQRQKVRAASAPPPAQDVTGCCVGSRNRG